MLKYYFRPIRIVLDRNIPYCSIPRSTSRLQETEKLDLVSFKWRELRVEHDEVPKARILNGLEEDWVILEGFEES
jgi:hypothetical protein